MTRRSYKHVLRAIDRKPIPPHHHLRVTQPVPGAIILPPARTPWWRA